MSNSDQAARILWGKRVVVIGDSIQRSIYKDLVRLLVPDRNSTYLTSQHLKTKGELEFLGDKLLQGGQLGEMKNGINYREVRQFDSGTTIIKFYFVTRCYSEYMMSVLHELKTMEPHVVIMNSCLWDLHRYGPYGLIHYVDNMYKLTYSLKKAIPSDAVFIWNATLPLDSTCKGGFLLPYFESISSREIIEANVIASEIVLSHNFTFLDLYSVFVNRTDLRENDGTHWNHLANRIISNNILMLLSYAWNLPIPKPAIQDPPVLHPYTEFFSKPFGNNSLALSPRVSDHYGLSQIMSDSYFTPKPTIHDPRVLYPHYEFSSNPLNYSLPDSRCTNDNDRYRAILKNLENSQNLLRNNFSRESFPTDVFFNPHPTPVAMNRIIHTPFPSMEDLVLMRHRTASTSPSDVLFANHHPPPQTLHLRTTSPPDRHLFGASSLSTTLHHRYSPSTSFPNHLAERSSHSQHSPRPEMQWRPCHPLPKLDMLLRDTLLHNQSDTAFRRHLPYFWTHPLLHQ